MTNRPQPRALFLASLLALTGIAAAQNAEPIREGDGQRRTDLNRMELKPFPAEAWGKLSDWKNGPAISPSDYKGKVVLIFTWSDYVPTSQKALDLAKRLAEQKGKDGLVVVGAHGSQGWAEANKPAAAEGSKFLLALDAKREFRAALKSDADPDFYLIDRAGQLRFADVTTETASNGVDLLLAETPESAGKLNDTIAAKRAADEAGLRRPDDINQKLDLTNVPELPFAKPAPEAYTKAKWPRVPRDPNNNDANVKAEARPITLPPDTDFFPKKPVTDGRITLVYLWHPREFFTFDRDMPEADLLQRQYGRDLAVVGALFIPQGQSGQRLRDEDKDPEKLRAKMQEFAKARQTKHAFVLDAGNSLLNTVLNNQNEFPYPMIILISTDGQARWWSSKEGNEYRGPLLTMLENDPGVLARRKAEEEYIKARKK